MSEFYLTSPFWICPEVAQYVADRHGEVCGRVREIRG